MKEPILELAFSAGIDQSQRSELMDPRAGFAMLENVRSPTKGAAVKRQGYATLTGSTRIDATGRSTTHRMFPHGKQTCTISQSGILDSYSSAAGASVPRGLVHTAGIALHAVPVPGGASTNVVHDCESVNGYVAVVTRTTVGTTEHAVVTVLDMSTMGIVSGPQVVATHATMANVALASYSTYLVLLYSQTGGTIGGYYLDTASGSTIAAGWTSFSTGIADQAIDDEIAVQSFSGNVAVMYHNNSGGASELTVKLITIAGTATSQTIATGGTPDFIACSGVAGDTLFCAWSEGTDVKAIALNPSTLATTGTTDTIITTTSNPGRITVAMGVSTGEALLLVDDGTAVYREEIGISGGAVAANGLAMTHYNVGLAGRAYAQNSRYLCPVVTAATDKADSVRTTHVLGDFTDPVVHVRPVAMPIAAGLSVHGLHHAKSVTGTASTTRLFPLAVARSSAANAIFLIEYDFVAQSRWRPAQFGRGTYLSGGVLLHFDGVRAAEVPYVQRPTQPEATAGGTGITLVTGRRYVAVYEEVDANGDWHQSSVSDPSASTGAVTNKTLTLSTSSLTVTHRYNGASSYAPTSSQRVAWYATKDGGEPPYFRLGTTAIDPTAATVTFADATSDATLAVAAQLFAPSLPGVDGGAQDRRAPPGLSSPLSYNGMLVGSVGSDIWYSGQDVVGEGAWFNPAFQVPIPGDGNIIALAAQDGTLFAFLRNAIFALSGTAPSDNGAEGGLGTPIRLAVDFGARLPFTCVTSLGIFFVSERGIELLDRNRAVQFVGEGIQDTFASYPYVTAMTYDPVSSCVLIEAASGFSSGLATGTGRTFVFDTRARVWRSIDRRGVSATADVPAQDACLAWNGSAYRYAWLRGSDGATYVETDAHKLDPGSARVRMYAKTPWIHIAGIQGEQNVEGVMLLGAKVEDHDLELGVAHDYDETFVSETRDSDAVDAMAIYNPHFDIDQQTGQAVMVEIEDAVPTGTASDDAGGDSAEWVALTFVGVPKQGVKRTSSVLRGGT